MADEIEALVDSGTMYTPESQKMRRRLAEAMMKSGMDTSPIASPWQGAARIAQAMLGGYNAFKLGEEEKGKAKDMADFRAGQYGVGPPSLSSAPGAPKPPMPTDAAAAPVSDFREWVKQKEGWNPNAYGDYKQTSIGYGTRANPGERTISREEGEKRLDVELGKARMLVQSWGQGQGVKLSPKQEDALTDLTYNSGTTWMNQGIAAAIKSGNLPLAQKLFEGYINAGGKPLDGLIARRKELSPWLLDTTPAAPAQVAQAAIPGTASDVPPVGAPAMPGIMVQPGAPSVPAGPVPAPQAPAPAMTPAASPGAPPGPAPAPMSQAQIMDEAKRSLGSRRSIVELGLRSTTPEVYKAAENEMKAAIARVTASQPPVDLKKSADLDLTRSNIAENQAQLPKHQADARKANAEAKKTEIETMSLRTPAESYDRALKALNTAAAYPERFGKFAFERGLGPYVGANIAGSEDRSWNVNPVDFIGKIAGQAGNALSHLTEGGASPAEVQAMVGGLQSELGQMIRKANGMSAKEGDSNVELQNFLRMVGQLGTSTSQEDYQRRLADVNERFARMMGQEVRPISAEPVRPDQRADTATHLHRQASDAMGITSVEEGTVITNKQTGERKVMRGGQWQPL
jgi:GH24 family phage-related lysozyme (muramidase)